VANTATYSGPNSNGTWNVNVNGLAVMQLSASGGSSAQTRAQTVAARLNNLFNAGVNLDFITPGYSNSTYVVWHTPWGSSSPSIIASATYEDQLDYGVTPWELALVWANNIRYAVTGMSLCTNGRKQLYSGPNDGSGPVVSTNTAIASFYSYETAYGATASGDCWHPYDITCAIWAMSYDNDCLYHTNYVPFGTYIRVTNQSNGLSVVCRVNDRGPNLDTVVCPSSYPYRLIDLSKGAANAIGLSLGTVTIEQLS